MNAPQDDRRLRELLAQAVDDIEPTHRLDAIRARIAGATTRTGDEESTMSTSRTKLAAVAAAVIGTAAVITGIAWAGGILGDSDDAPPVAGTPTAEPTANDPTDQATDEPAGKTFTARVFYVGDTPGGPRLFSEMREVSGASAVEAAVRAAVAEVPLDPDYESPWPDGTRVEAVGFDGIGEDGFISVVLSGDVPRERPESMPPIMAELAVQQLVHTATTSFGVPAQVDFLAHNEQSGENEELDQLLGVDVSELMPADPLEVMALVQIAEPAEGAVASGSLEVSGMSSSFEATVPWQVLSGADVVLDGSSFQAEGWIDGLHPFAGTIDLAELEPGTYTLKVMTDDPSGGTEGPGPTSDTRTFTIE